MAAAARLATIAAYLQRYHQDLRQRILAPAVVGGLGAFQPNRIVLTYLGLHGDVLCGHPIARNRRGGVDSPRGGSSRVMAEGDPERDRDGVCAAPSRDVPDGNGIDSRYISHCLARPLGFDHQAVSNRQVRSDADAAGRVGVEPAVFQGVPRGLPGGKPLAARSASIHRDAEPETRCRAARPADSGGGGVPYPGGVGPTAVRPGGGECLAPRKQQAPDAPADRQADHSLGTV